MLVGGALIEARVLECFLVVRCVKHQSMWSPRGSGWVGYVRLSTGYSTESTLSKHYARRSCLRRHPGPIGKVGGMQGAGIHVCSYIHTYSTCR